MMLVKSAFLILSTVYLANAIEGDLCTMKVTGVQGTCVNIRNCQSAIEAIKKRINPQICSFSGTDPIVCCSDNSPSSTATTTPAPPVATTSKRPVQSTTIEIPVYDYKNNDGSAVEECEPISPTLTSPRTGQKAFDKCLEYQEKYVYPCAKGVDLAGAMSRTSKCHHNADDLIIGGEDARQDEFPHMALLGYGSSVSGASWQCGGSLVSDSFVLTAGHCTISRAAGPVSFIRVGTLLRSQPLDQSKIRKVKRIIPHPQYKAPIRYHDIALVEMDTPVVLDQYLVPACIHVPSDQIADDRALAAGWGLTEYKGQTSDILQKVILNKFKTEECQSKFPENRLMKGGFDKDSQICYGDKNASKDTCQGDSGGPLQIKSKSIHCTYTVVGVTSFGRACGYIGEPGIYTRVANYVAWIESVVWPN